MIKLLEMAGLTVSKISALIERRNQAKTNKDYDEADRIRQQIRDSGILLEDSCRRKYHLEEDLKYRTKIRVQLFITSHVQVLTNQRLYFAWREYEVYTRQLDFPFIKRLSLVIFRWPFEGFFCRNKFLTEVYRGIDWC